jgi:pyruvate decarboxylase
MTPNVTAITVGAYIAARLGQLGLEHYFAVPGDYNLVLLDGLLSAPGLQYIGCCNELNAGYAADGYARARGVGAVVVTYSVGSLSVLNAVAGSASEELPLIVIAGGPGTRAKAEGRRLHHTLGTLDYAYPRTIFEQICAESVILPDLDEAPALIDRTLMAAVSRRQPVYIEVPCDLAGGLVSPPQPLVFNSPAPIDPASLEAAIAAVAAMIADASRPVLVAGVRLRQAGAIEAFLRLADRLGSAVAVMPDAKGFFPEDHPGYIGVYWGPVSTQGTAGIVESADLCLFAGPMFTDYTTVGFNLAIGKEKLLQADAHAVTLPGASFQGVPLAPFLDTLAARVGPKPASLEIYRRGTPVPPAATSAPDPGSKLTTLALMSQVQAVLGPETTVLAETGDSWFNGLKLRLPAGARFEIQMRYGSIGWSVPATLGLALGQEAGRRVVALIGDGSFQLTAQEFGTMIRSGVRPIVFLINNRGYTIEVEIHDGPYNNIKNWDYAGLVAVLNGGEGNGWGCRVATGGELAAAIEHALRHDGPALIECLIDRDECSLALREWGVRVAAFNGRPPLTP